MFHRSDRSVSNPSGCAITDPPRSEATRATIPFWRFSLLESTRSLRIASTWGSYGLIVVAVTVLVMRPLAGAFWASQNTVDPCDAQNTVTADSAADDDDDARRDFLEIYHLAAGQNLKRIEPPRPRGADVWWKRKFGVNAGAGPEEYGSMTFRYRDSDDLENWVGLFGSATQGYPIRNLPDAIGMGIDPAEIAGDPALLKTAVTGDWIFRQGVPAEQMVGSLESILKRALRLRINLTFRQVARDVVVARGRYRYTPLPGRFNNEVDVYGKQLAKDANSTSRAGDLPKFLKELGGFIGRPVVNEAEAAPKDRISWFTHVRSPFTPQMHREDHDEVAVLEHLHEQTGLTVTREMKPIRVLFVERAK
jgi:hypothetical protein